MLFLAENCAKLVTRFHTNADPGQWKISQRSSTGAGLPHPPLGCRVLRRTPNEARGVAARCKVPLSNHLTTTQAGACDGPKGFGPLLVRGEWGNYSCTGPIHLIGPTTTTNSPFSGISIFVISSIAPR